MELSKNYLPDHVEDKWYKHWTDKGLFKSQPDERIPFTVVIPPPNVTGVLHMGHTLNETVQDILVRKARMSGFNACWVPGSDHASIATEAKVVAMLKEKNIDKNSLTREAFLQYAFEWKEKYGNIIYSQIAKLGCSVDWDRVSFTMDPGYYKAVIKVFNTLYNKGIIYRGARMINWDTAAKTALSDEEVEHKEVTGKLYYIKYLLTGDLPATEGNEAPADLPGKQALPENFIVIATQRPETMMGDTAVCANPADERYIHLKGRSVIIPLINKKIPVIFDEYVDKEFGTGILKITPAHDINDYNISLKHKLPIIDILNENGTLSEAAQIYVGEDRFAVRKKVVEDLRQQGHLIKEEEYQTRLGFSQRTNVVVEPKISTQWFIRMKALAEPALQAVINGEIQIHPGEKFIATYKYWLENVKDWCISRQLWWGHRIPAWYDDQGRLVVAESKEEAEKNYVEKYGRKSLLNKKEPLSLTQDEDVLDTWFSSWLWPIQVFKGITEPGNPEIDYYYPTAVLVTGQDIIFFWVARMIMAGMEFKNEKPFSDVYFTGMVRDKQGRKMSKQLGNSPDLLELIQKYGADAVRFGIMISSPAGNDLLFDEASLEQGRNFNNKVWNALKLVKMWEGRQSSASGEPSTETFAITWFQNRLSEVIPEIEILYKQFKLSEALKTIYSLIWDDFCSWYLEWIKEGFAQPMQQPVYQKTVQFFETLLLLLHPFMPFITEEIFQLLREQHVDLASKQFNQVIETLDQRILEQGLLLKEAISSIRDMKNKNNISPKEKIKLYLQTNDENNYRNVEALLLKQVNAETIEYVDKPPAGLLAVVVKKDKFFIGTAQALNIASQQEQLLKDLAHLKGFLKSVEIKLNNEKFVQNAKAEVVELEKKKKADAETKIRIIEEALSVPG